MTRSRTKLEPWIENMIISHGTENEMNTANLKARVIAVGTVTSSQALGAQGSPELLFLSDGVVQIPAVLTDAAWEHLQQEEDRECLSSLVHTMVCLQTYSLQFHMDPEKRKSRFFLSLGMLATMAAGPIKDCPPCCTTLPSVRVKICDTWRTLQSPESVLTQSSQSAGNLSELLGVWQYDCLMDFVEEIQERLTAARGSASQQPSTSRDPLPPPSGVPVRTGWDVDRVRFKGAGPFSVPVAHLVIPDRVAPPPEAPAQPVEGGGTQSGLIPPSGDRPVVSSMPAAQPRASTSGHHGGPRDTARGRGFEETTTAPPREGLHHVCEALFLDQSNPWNMFPPPSEVFCTSSSSETSLVKRLSPSQAGCEESFLPPYQNPPAHAASCLTPVSSGSSPPDSMAQVEPIAVLSSGEKIPCLAVEADVCSEKDLQGTTSSACRVKRKRPESCHRQPGTAAGPEQEGVPQVDLSPPSWLFESQRRSTPQAGCSSQQAGGASSPLPPPPPMVHSDGSHFSYRYKVSRKNMQDLSRFKVADDHLRWAVKYLVVPKHVDKP
ncbi:hypothetical protein CRUP_007551 [Coryphaenoides rupestris]|nr:hypothetical protein CRUP_007551 [Coryphaenoides rupestris]